jgi:hypothetical protein
VFRPRLEESSADELELLGVQERPEDVFPGLLLVLVLGEPRFHEVPFFLRRRTGEGPQVQVADLLGVRAFLISGTLLGYVRDGAVIAWDKDIDVGVFSDETDLEAMDAAFEASMFQVRRIDFTSTRLRVQHVDGVAIDIFPHYWDGDARLFWHDGAATRWWNTPFGLTRTAFLGVDSWIPDDPERYLDENYGPWRTPDPHFDARLDAPNVEVTDEEYLTTLTYFSLLDALSAGNRRKLARYRTLLHRRGEGEWLDRLPG